MTKYVVIAYLPDTAISAGEVEDAINEALGDRGIEPLHVTVQVPATRTIGHF